MSAQQPGIPHITEYCWRIHQTLTIARLSKCGLTFREGNFWDLDHTIPSSLGGESGCSNLQLLHRHCHDTKTASDGCLGRTHDKGQVIEEPDEAKVSSPVLQTSGCREMVA